MKKSLDNNIFLSLSILMAVIVILSNYLVQFPFEIYNLQEFLTWGAFSYPVAFLITDLTNRKFGTLKAKKIVYFGFALGITTSLLFSTDQINLISIRITIGSGTAFLIAQLLDIKIFDKLRNKIWFVPPLISSIFASFIDTMIFFFIAFYATEVNWINLAIGDYLVKLIITFLMLIPFRLVTQYLFEFRYNN